MSILNVSSIERIECNEVNEQNASMRCEWTQMTPACTDHDGYLDYIYFMFCTFGVDGTPGAVCITVLWLLVLFVALGVTADDFLCPALVVISKTLRLSQNIAGVTFLAFGNGAPDIFSSLAGIEQARSDLVIGELFGAGMFVTTVVAGSICVTKPFKIMERPFLRDIIFYIFATYWAFYLFYSHQIQLKYAAGFVALYGVYIMVVIISRIVYQRNKSPTEESGNSSVTSASDVTDSPSMSSFISSASSNSVFLTESDESVMSTMKTDVNGNSKAAPSPMTTLPLPSVPVNITITPPEDESRKSSLKSNASRKKKPSSTSEMFCGAKSEDDPEAAGVVLRRFSFRNNLSMPRRRTLSNHRNVEIPGPPDLASSKICNNPAAPTTKKERPPFLQQFSTTSMMSLISKGPNDRITPWKDFVFELCPIDFNTWKDRSWFSRIVDIVKSPVYFLLAFTTPVVDYEADLHNWCKYLSVLQCITGPLFVCFCTHKWNMLLGGSFPLWALVLIISASLAIVVFFTSIVDEPPCYHAVFAYLGFAVSVMWIYALAHEVVSLLKAIGVVFDMSDTILGLTVLAWGNSIGDFISNTSVAKQGFPRMGISACFGGPLLNLLLGIGIPYTVTLVKTGSPIELEYTKLVTVLYGGIAISLVSTLVIMTSLRFEVRRWYGIFLIVLYLCFLTVAILVELQVI